MTTAASDLDEGNTLCFVPAFEGVHGILAEIHVYLFDEDGTLIDRQALRKGKAIISLRANCQRRARAVIGPRVDEFIQGPVTLDKMRAFHGYELPCPSGADVLAQCRPKVPEAIWRWWLVHSLWGTLKTGSDQQAAAVGS